MAVSLGPKRVAGETFESIPDFWMASLAFANELVIGAFFLALFHKHCCSALAIGLGHFSSSGNLRVPPGEES